MADWGGPALVLVHGLPLDAPTDLSATFRARREDVLAPDVELTLGGRFDDTFDVEVLDAPPDALHAVLPSALSDAFVRLHGTDDAEAMVHRGALFVRTITGLPQAACESDALETAIEGTMDRIGRTLVETVPAPRPFGQ